MSDFYERVIALTRAIPEGKILTYGFLAELLGAPGAARAVGYALRVNKEKDVPWQRVVGKRGVMGKISIRSLAYSRDEQIVRLQDEGIEFDDNEEFLLMKYLWQPSPEEIQQILQKTMR